MNITFDKDHSIEDPEATQEFLRKLWGDASVPVVNSFGTKDREGSIRFTCSIRLHLIRDYLKELVDLRFIFGETVMVLGDIAQEDFKERVAGQLVQVTIYFCAPSRN